MQSLNRIVDAQKTLARLTRLKADVSTANAELGDHWPGAGTGETPGPPKQEQPQSNPGE